MDPGVTLSINIPWFSALNAPALHYTSIWSMRTMLFVAAPRRQWYTMRLFAS
jgi:hypothetical protein